MAMAPEPGYAVDTQYFVLCACVRERAKSNTWPGPCIAARVNYAY